jgi:hypothetical protein
MKRFLTAFALAAALAGCAAPHARQEFDFSELPLTRGVVESVQDLPRDIHAFGEAVVHQINPEKPAQLVIRLDSGRAITLQGVQRFEAGQRVRVVAGRLERE